MYGSQFNYTNVPIRRTAVSATTDTITLPFNGAIESNFVIGPVINTQKTFALRNDQNANEFWFTFELGSLASLAFPENFRMSDSRWDNVNRLWTPLEIGQYQGHAIFDGTGWNIDIIGPYSNIFVPTLETPDLFFNNLYSDQVILYWSPGADAYEVQLATDAGFVNVVGSYIGSANSQTFNGLNADTQYYARVKAIQDGFGDSPYGTADFYTMPNVVAAYDFSGLRRQNTNRYGTMVASVDSVNTLFSIFNTSGPQFNSSTPGANPILSSSGDNPYAVNGGSSVYDSSAPIALGNGAFTLIFKVKFTSNPVASVIMVDAVTGGNRLVRLDGTSIIYVAINGAFSAPMNFPANWALNTFNTFIIECDGINVRASADGGSTWTNSVARPGGGAAWQLTRIGGSQWEYLVFCNYQMTAAQRNRVINRHIGIQFVKSAVDFSLPARNLPSGFIADPVNNYVNSFTGGLLLKGGYGLGKNVFSIGSDNVVCINRPIAAPDYANSFLLFHNTITGKVRDLIDLGYYATTGDIHEIPVIQMISNMLYITQMANHYDKGLGSCLHVRKSWKNFDFLGILQLPKAKEDVRHYHLSEAQYPQAMSPSGGSLVGVFVQRWEILQSFPPKIQIAISDDGLQSFREYITIVDTATANNWVYPVTVYNGSRDECYVIVEHVIAGVNPVRCAGLCILRTTDFVTYQNMSGTWSKNVKTAGAISLSELYTNATLLDARALTSTLIGHAMITPGGMMYGVVGNGSNTGWRLFYQTVGGGLTLKDVTFGGDSVVTGTQTNTLGTFTFPYHRSPIAVLYKGGTTFDVVALQVNGGNWRPTLYRSTDMGDNWIKIGVLNGIDAGLQHTELEFSQNYHFNNDVGVLACSAALSATTGKLFIRDANNLV